MTTVRDELKRIGYLRPTRHQRRMGWFGFFAGLTFGLLTLW